MPRDFICRCVAILVLAVGLLGCGLSEYEKKMETELERLEYLDAEASYLAAPVKFVGKDEKDATVQSKDVFVRPPRGITDKADAKTIGTMLYSYPARGKSPFKDVLVAATKTKKDDEFRREVMSPLGGVKELTPKTYEHKANNHTVKVRQTKVEDTVTKTTSFVNFYQEGGVQLAVVFRVDSDNTTNAQAIKMMEYSLNALAAGKASREQWSGFKAPTGSSKR